MVHSQKASKLLVLIGAPGAGKGTQSRLLKDAKIVCAGDVLRDEIRRGGEHSANLAALLSQGQMAPEHITSALLKQKIIELESIVAKEYPYSADAQYQQYQYQQPDNAFYLLDGYPRSEEQAYHFVEWFESNDSSVVYFERDYTVILHLLASKDCIAERLRGRLIHATSGRTYHTVFNPPLRDQLDDETEEPLSRRDDDLNPEAVYNRLETYKRKTIPTMEVLEKHGFQVIDVPESSILETHRFLLDVLRRRGFITAERAYYLEQELLQRQEQQKALAGESKDATTEYDSQSSTLPAQDYPSNQEKIE